MQFEVRTHAFVDEWQVRFFSSQGEIFRSTTDVLSGARGVRKAIDRFLNITWNQQWCIRFMQLVIDCNTRKSIIYEKRDMIYYHNSSCSETWRWSNNQVGLAQNGCHCVPGFCGTKVFASKLDVKSALTFNCGWHLRAFHSPIFCPVVWQSTRMLFVNFVTWCPIYV